MAQYVQIVAINSLSSAAEGALVSIAVQVKNLDTHGFYVGITGDHNGSGISFSPDYAGVDGGGTYTFYGSFFMPNKSVTITVTSWWWGSDSVWHRDDTETKTVSLVTLTPQISEFQITDFSKV
jgi:hypothetical protein